MRETRKFPLNHWPDASTVLILFFLVFSGCGEQSNRQTTGSESIAADGGFSTPLPKPLQKHRVGLSAEVEVVNESGTLVRTEALAINPDTHQVSGKIDGLPTGAYTFTIYYRINDVLVATQTISGTVNENTETPIVFDSLSLPDKDGDGFTNLAEMEDGTDPSVAGNPNLNGLTLSRSTLNPVFDTNMTSYTASVGFLVPTVAITPTADDVGAGVTVNGATLSPDAPVSLSEGDNAIHIVVTAVDGRTKTYTITLNRQSAANFAQQAYIKASNTGTGDRFGLSVALSGDTLAVGAFSEDSSATGVNGDETNNAAGGSGAVYVFTRSAGTWSQQAYLKASNTGASDQFGRSVALSGDTLAVGAYFEASSATGVNGDETDNAAADSGAAYVFTRNAGAWSQQAYLKASNTGVSDEFGVSMALSGDTLAVGASSEDSSATEVNGDETDNAAANSGAVYVFTRSAGAWNQQAYLKASNTGVLDEFGLSVALSGDTLAVGASSEDSSATGVNGDETDNAESGSGAVYVRQ